MALLHERLDRAATTEPERIAIQTDSVSLSLSELAERAHAMAIWLSEQGIERGDRIIIQAENDPISVVLIYAISAVGGCFVPVHPSTPPEQLAYIEGNSEARLVISHVAGKWVARDGNTRQILPDPLEFRPSKGVQTQLTKLDPEIVSEDLACMIYTSGSTGRPKGVTCLHRQMTFSIGAIAEALDYRVGDRVFCALPLSFDYGLYQIFLAIESGASLWLDDPEVGGLGLFKALKNSEAHVLPAVPPMIDALAVMSKRKPGGLPNLRLITNTGGAPSPESIKTLRTALPNLGFQLMYGLTECKRVSITPVDGDLQRPGTCGKPLRGTRVEVVDDSGTPLPAGEVGEFVVYGANMMAGYWKDDDLTQKTYRKQHATLPRLHSGDYGWMDEEGYLYCQGRRDDIFKIRGFRVSCSEIEAAATEAPEVHHAVMVPPAKNRAATLFVCAPSGEFDLLPFLANRLERHKLPEKVRFIDDMPRTANNKYDRKALISLMEAERAKKTTTEGIETYA